MRQSLTQVSHC